ncbi:MAG: prepilin-type N-terminal cleavage/methylation domain-containing protein [Verrucomicrobiota bacterium]
MITPHKKTFSGGFTLIELLIVIAIIAILASLVLAAAGSVQKKGARSRAEGEIAALGAALESYKADNGDYPSNSVTGNSACLVTNLMPTNGTKVYYEFKTKSVDSSGYLDPFGYSYKYIYTNGSPNNGTNNYDLWSTAGNSGSTNTWIKNW